jgi:hypothetical protein
MRTPEQIIKEALDLSCDRSEMTVTGGELMACRIYIRTQLWGEKNELRLSDGTLIPTVVECCGHELVVR